MAYKATKKELSYCAGFFDGEGCIMIRKKHKGRPYHTLLVAITSTNKNILEYFKMVFGGKVYGAYKTKPHYKDKWQWCLGAKGALAFLKAIYPYLKLKNREAEVGMEFQEQIKWQRNMMLRVEQEAIQEGQYVLMKLLKGDNAVGITVDQPIKLDAL